MGYGLAVHSPQNKILSGDNGSSLEHGQNHLDVCPLFSAANVSYSEEGWYPEQLEGAISSRERDWMVFNCEMNGM